MYLERLLLSGFKSFAKPIELTFQPGIVAIVGPNGSGKSNVADAVRWVMGEQSMKLLRGKKSADVIFSGSQAVGRLGMAEVTLLINNHDGQMPIDTSEVAIARRLFQDGTSEYTLNGTSARLSDIQLLLARSNFGQRTYSVIGQGMVDEVLSATPFERREYFEEAAGIKAYQIKREQSLNKLTLTWENLQTAEIQIREIEPHLKSLTRQVKRLEQREETEQELKILQQRYFGHMWHEAHRACDSHQKTIDELALTRETAELRVIELQQQMASLTRESSHADRYDSFQIEYKRLLQEKNALRERELTIKTSVALDESTRARATVPRELVGRIAREIIALRKQWDSLLREFSAIDTFERFLAWRHRASLDHERLSRLAGELSAYVPSTPEDDTRAQELVELARNMEKIDADLTTLDAKQRELASLEKKERTRIWQLQNMLQEAQKHLNEAVSRENTSRIELARFETRREDIAAEITAELGITIDPSLLPCEAPEQPEALLGDIRRLKNRLEMIGGIDPDVQREYEETSARFGYLTGEVEDLRSTFESLKGVLHDLDHEIQQRFTEAFERIDRGFQDFFKRLFNGGSAKLVLVKPEQHAASPTLHDLEPIAAESVLPIQSEEMKLIARYKKKEQLGVDISASPPGKRVKHIGMLSGGERALTSIALICAILANNAAPFVVLDEVDAALDEANSIRLSEILADLAHQTQFIVITHNRATMEKAGILYGVTMGDDGISQVLSLKIEEAAEHTNR